MMTPQPATPPEGTHIRNVPQDGQAHSGAIVISNAHIRERALADVCQQLVDAIHDTTPQPRSNPIAEALAAAAELGITKQQP